MKEYLEKIRALLSEPSKWTQGCMARNPFGVTLSNPEHPEATCWCLVGAVVKITPALEREQVLIALQREHGFPSAVQWNDSPFRKHHEVLSLLDKLIGD